jgi:hypothetical protein
MSSNNSNNGDLLSFLAMLGDSPRLPPTFRDFPRPILTSSQSLSLRDVFRCLPVVLHYSPLELFFAGASQTSLELPSLRWSSPVFAGASQSSLEPPSLRWSLPVFAGVPPSSGVPILPEFPIHLRSSLFISGVPYSSPEFLRSSLFVSGVPPSSPKFPCFRSSSYTFARLPLSS